MSFHVRIVPRAERDVQQIFDWLAARSADGALRWWDAFELAAAKLSENPLGYGLAPENELADTELRQFLLKTRRGRIYRGVFRVSGDEVQILRVRGPGQPPLQADELE